MAGPGLACVEVFAAQREDVFELKVSPADAIEGVKMALTVHDGVVNPDAVVGNFRVNGLDADHLCSALGGVASIGDWIEAVAPHVAA